MSIFSDVGGVPFVSASSGEDKGMGQGAMWVFALIVLVFVALFGLGGFGRRDDNRTSGIAEIAALNAAGSLSNGNSNVNTAAFTELNGRLNGLAAQVNHINDVNDLRDLKSTQALINQNISQQASNLSSQISNNRTDTLLNFKDLALQVAQSNCDIRRDIDGVRFDNAQSTCAIINAVNAGAQRVVDNQVGTEMARLRDELSRERLASSQIRQDLFIERQSDRVIGALTPPCPVPAYPSWPSNQPINPIAYGGIPGGGNGPYVRQFYAEPVMA